MNRQVAFRLADEALISTAPDASLLLRPVLAETFEMMEAPEAQLIARDSGEVKVYLLHPSGLSITNVRAESPTTGVQWVDLSETTITRQCDEVKGNHSGIWWQTTWRLIYGQVSEVFVGHEGPQSVDEVERFARAVARAAGWPIAPLVTE